MLRFYKKELKQLTERLRREGVGSGQPEVKDDSMDSKLTALSSLAGERSMSERTLAASSLDPDATHGAHVLPVVFMRDLSCRKGNWQYLHAACRRGHIAAELRQPEHAGHQEDPEEAVQARPAVLAHAGLCGAGDRPPA